MGSVASRALLHILSDFVKFLNSITYGQFLPHSDVPKNHLGQMSPFGNCSMCGTACPGKCVSVVAAISQCITVSRPCGPTVWRGAAVALEQCCIPAWRHVRLFPTICPTKNWNLTRFFATYCEITSFGRFQKKSWWPGHFEKSLAKLNSYWSMPLALTPISHFLSHF